MKIGGLLCPPTFTCVCVYYLYPQTNHVSGQPERLDVEQLDNRITDPNTTI